MIQASKVPQLAARIERRTNDVRDAEDWQDGTIHDRSRDSRASGSLSLSRSGSSRHQQRVPDENRISTSDSLLDQHDGTSPLRSVRHDSEF